MTKHTSNNMPDEIWVSPFGETGKHPADGSEQTRYNAHSRNTSPSYSVRYIKADLHTPVVAGEDKVDDTAVMKLWRDAGLPEYFLGNGGTNTRLVKFAKLCALQQPPAPDMLVALKVVRDWHTGKSNPTEKEICTLQDVLNVVGVAISKAEGRS